MRFYISMMDACLKPYGQFTSQKDLLDAFETAAWLWPVYAALCGYRLMMACGQAQLMAHQPGKLVASLRTWMTLSQKIDGP